MLLYASMRTEACDERVEVRSPILSAGARTASVTAPSSTDLLAKLLDPDRTGNVTAERRRFADHLVGFSAGRAVRTAQIAEARVA